MAVYFVQAGTDGPIKIGVSSHVQGRFASLQTASPVRLVLLGCIDGGRETEVLLHKKFKHLRILRGEWFRPEADLIETIKEYSKIYAGTYGNVFGIRLSVDEKALLTKALEIELQPGDRGGPSSWARRVLLREAKKVVDEAPPSLETE